MLHAKTYVEAYIEDAMMRSEVQLSVLGLSSFPKDIPYIFV
jgi:hypothetical protein